MPGSDVPVVTLDLMSESALQDPMAVFRQVLESGPVLYEPNMQRYIVGHFDDVKRVSGKAAEFAPDAEFHEKMVGGRDFLGMDDPEHSSVRGVFAPAFANAAISELEPTIKGLVDRALDDVANRIREGDVVDAVPHIAEALGAGTIAAILNVSDSDIPDFMRWSHEMGKATEALVESDPIRRVDLEREGDRATQAMLEFAGRELDARRRGLKSSADIVGSFASAPAITGRMSENDQRANIARIVIGGHDNTVKMIGHMLVVLGQHPEQRDMVARDRTLVSQTIEELCRFVTSAPVIPKVARAETIIGQCVLPPGAPVFAMLGAANHDPARWDEPDRFDILRPSKSHLAFGFGPHGCIGAAVTRMELRLVLEGILDRVPRYELADEEITYGPLFLACGPLAVRLT